MQKVGSQTKWVYACMPIQNGVLGWIKTDKEHIRRQKWLLLFVYIGKSDKKLQRTSESVGKAQRGKRQCNA